MNLMNKTIGEALAEGKERLRAAGKEAYCLEAELLLEEAAQLDHLSLYMQENELLPQEAAERYEMYLFEREMGRPAQYIIGQWEFMGLPFAVGEGVLIPRPDTEILVEIILQKQKEEPLKSILDIGTGSGCIPVSLSFYGTFEEILAVDISQLALAYARKSAIQNGAAIKFYESDLFSDVPAEYRGRLDAIVSNPPYIPRAEIETLMIEVRGYEPWEALDGGEDGLDFYRRIIREGKDWLREDGWLFFEIGYNEKDAVIALMEESGYVEISAQKDFAGLDRVVYGRRGRTEEA